MIFFHSVESDILKSMASKRIRNNLTKSLWQTLTDNKTQTDEALFYINAKFDTVSQKFISWVFLFLIPYLLKLRTQLESLKVYRRGISFIVYRAKFKPRFSFTHEKPLTPGDLYAIVV